MTDALVIQDLRKVYASGVEALRGIDLTVEEGDFYALLGPNGAGKSTTIGIVTSLVNKTSGKVKIFGYDLDTEMVRAKQQIGLVPQEFNFNPFETVQQIVVNQAGYYGVSRKEAMKRSEKYLKQSNLWEKRNERARMLSGGMKRRLMIARALMHEPKLLILDEPTAGVDIELRREMWAFLQELNAQGTTIILTTHYLEEAEMLCRNIGIIQSGELIDNTSMKHWVAKLQFETCIFDLAPYTQAPVIEGYQSVFEDELTLAVEVERNQGVNHLFEQLSQQGIKVLSMRNKSNRLEELFLKITEDTYQREDQQTVFYCFKKFSCEGNQPLFTNLGPNTGTASNYDVLIFCDFWENDWRANWRYGRFFLYGIYRARFNYDVSHYKLVRQCFIFLFLTKIPEKYRRNSLGASSNSCDYLGICDWWRWS